MPGKPGSKRSQSSAASDSKPSKPHPKRTPDDPRPPKSGRGKREPSGDPCKHESKLRLAEVAKVFTRKTFRKALCGKALLKSEIKDLSRLQPHVDWFHPFDLHLCLCCGRAFDGHHLHAHLKPDGCILALSFDAQQIYCLECDKFYPITPGSCCAKILGIEDPEPALAPAAPRERQRGLINFGNSCWMNSVLQVLFRVPAFCAATDGPLAAAFAGLFRELSESTRAVRPHAFATELVRQRDFFDVREQHDAYEFLILFLDAVRDEQHAVSTGLLSGDRRRVEACLTSPLDAVFGFIMATTTRCEVCRAENQMFERSAVISLGVPYGGMTNVAECLQVFFSESSIEGRACEFCGEVGEAVTCPAFIPEFMPRVLLLHLTRFRVGKNGYVKNNVRVDFPEILSLDEIFGFDLNYRLLGLVTHMGTIDGGHYMSVARIADRYLLFNDDVVQVTAIERVLAFQAYILFYERIG